MTYQYQKVQGGAPPFPPTINDNILPSCCSDANVRHVGPEQWSLLNARHPTPFTVSPLGIHPPEELVIKCEVIWVSSTPGMTDDTMKITEEQ